MTLMTSADTCVYADLCVRRCWRLPVVTFPVYYPRLLQIFHRVLTTGRKLPALYHKILLRTETQQPLKRHSLKLLIGGQCRLQIAKCTSVT